MTHHLYWGDLHSHCSVSYGHGTVEQALLRSQQQLDFCSVTGHAFWPDMPSDRETYAEIIDYHNVGFARLARNWDTLLSRQASATSEGEFVALPSYEWHSLEFGDHNVYAACPELALRDAPNLPALRECIASGNAIAIPHHIGYAAGYRGIDWQHFNVSRSPFVEIFSLHGCSVADDDPFPMLHDMGPRDTGSTAVAGWQMGHRFGIVGGTDHHGAYPGSHGDGRMGVFATALTREALWDAFLARRVYAAIGDRIDARLFIDDAWIGSEIKSPGTRHLVVDVTGSDAIDHVDILKNERLLQRFQPATASDSESSNNYRLRITWGWGRKDKLIDWAARLTLSEGTITQVESCFSGQPIVAPKTQTSDEEIPDDEDLPHEILERNDASCVWRSVTTGNPTMRHQTTQAISFEINAPPSATVRVDVNGHVYEHALAELRHGGRSHYLQGWLSEAIRIGPLVPISACRVATEFTDEPEQAVDCYRMQVAQKNGQWAWLTPIWVER
jgi:hypothetical protein